MNSLDRGVANVLAQALDNADADDDPVVALLAHRAAVLDQHLDGPELAAALASVENRFRRHRRSPTPAPRRLV
jgi:hypothetical protein